MVGCVYRDSSYLDTYFPKSKSRSKNNMNIPTSFPSLTPTSSDDDIESSRLRNEAIAIASLSVVLYTLVAVIAYYYYQKFRQVKGEETTLLHTLSGKYDHAKRHFFAVLSASAILDIPTYLGCLANDGPVDCEWKAADQLFFWFLHLIALCGYAYCIIIPCILWSDMIEKKDGRLFFSEHSYGSIKRYFQILIISYFVNLFVNIVCCAAYWKQSDRLHYHESPTYEASALIEIILILLISGGCLYCGINLEIYVHEARLNPTTELKFLFTLNIILGCIVLSFLGRAILLLQFAPGMPSSYSLHFNYAVYTLVARWIPDVFCQLALVYIMRISSSEAKGYTHQQTSEFFRSTLHGDTSYIQGSHIDEIFSQSLGSSRVLSMNSVSGLKTHSSVEDSSLSKNRFLTRSDSATVSVDSSDNPRSRSHQATVDSTSGIPGLERTLLPLKNELDEDGTAFVYDRRMLSSD